MTFEEFWPAQLRLLHEITTDSTVIDVSRIIAKEAWIASRNNFHVVPRRADEFSRAKGE
jgi:hypothetical protein